MGTDTGELKDCPSCGARIAEAAVTCSLCKSRLGPCLGCSAWIIEGTECFDCGKSTAVRVRKAAAAPPPEESKYRFEGAPLGLLPLLALRLLLVAGFLAVVVLAVAASPMDPLTFAVIEKGVRPPNVRWPLLWAAAGGLLLAAGFAGSFVRRWRMNRTVVYGKAVEATTSLGSISCTSKIRAPMSISTWSRRAPVR